MTSTWTADELEAIGTANSIDIAPRRADGTASRFTTIWIVRVGDDLYIRSYRGGGGSWYRAAHRVHEGLLRLAAVERGIAFADAPDVDRAAIDHAYAAKYGRSSYVDAMVTDDAAATTMRLLPR